MNAGINKDLLKVILISDRGWDNTYWKAVASSNIASSQEENKFEFTNSSRCFRSQGLKNSTAI